MIYHDLSDLEEDAGGYYSGPIRPSKVLAPCNFVSLLIANLIIARALQTAPRANLRRLQEIPPAGPSVLFLTASDALCEAIFIRPFSFRYTFSAAGRSFGSELALTCSDHACRQS